MNFSDSNFRNELIQLAACVICVVQMYDSGDTSLNFRASETKSLTDVFEDIIDERERQENKWGTRTIEGTTKEWWYTVLGEEFGEVGRAILENN